MLDHGLTRVAALDLHKDELQLEKLDLVVRWLSREVLLAFLLWQPLQCLELGQHLRLQRRLLLTRHHLFCFGDNVIEI